MRWDWTSGKVEVGAGGFPGQATFLSAVAPQPYRITAISVGSYTGFRGEWEIAGRAQGIQRLNWRFYLLFAGDEIRLYTPDDGRNHRYEYLWLEPRASHFSFRVQACRDAHIALTTEPPNYMANTYELVIGANDNKRVSLRNGRSVSRLFLNFDFSFEPAFLID